MPGRSTSRALWGTLALLTSEAVALFFLIPRTPRLLAAPDPRFHGIPYGCPSAPFLSAGHTAPLALKPGEERVFRLRRRRGEVLEAVVDQEGVDVVVYLWSPHRRALLRVDGTEGAQGPEPVFAVAEENGSYCVEVAAGSVRARGFFKVRLAPRRRAQPRDFQRALGHRYFSLAEKLRNQDAILAALQPYYEKAQSCFRAVGERERLGSALYRLGEIHRSLGGNREARDYFAEAARAFIGLPTEAMAANRLGDVYQTLGESDFALQTYRHAQKIASHFSDQARAAGSLNNLGRLLQARGELLEALKDFEAALAAARALGDHKAQSVTFNNLAEFYLDVGRPEDARNAAREMIRHAQSRNDSSLEAYGRLSLGIAYQQLGDEVAADPELERALSLAQQAGDREGQADALLRLADAHLQKHRLPSARKLVEKALDLARATGNLKLEADACERFGGILRLQGNLPRALQYYEQARHLYLRLEDRDSAALALEGQARVLRQQKRLPEARAAIGESLSILESMRTRPGSDDLRSSFLASRLSAHELAVGLLMELDRREPGKGHDAEAFAVNESAHARTVLDELAEAEADVRFGVDPKLLGREAEIEVQLAALEKERELPGRAQTRTADLQSLRTERDLVEARIRAGNPRYALNHPQPLSLAEVQQQVLDRDDTALLVYALGEERSFLWLIRHDSFLHWELPPRQKIEALARKAHEGFSQNTRRSREALQEVLARLSQAVLGPAAGELRRDRLLVVADGALQYIPFVALPVAGRPLVLDHEIVNLPSASVLAVLRREIAHRPSPPKTVAVLANPVFRGDDKRLGHPPAPVSLSPPTGLADEDYRPLPYSQIEAESILRLVPPGKGLKALGFDANRRLATGTELSDYRTVHFATHAVFNAVHPELSGIVLSLFDSDGRPQKDGFLHAYEIYNLKLPVDLVVLSACRTALGPEIRGEGLSVLTRGFMYAGAPRVVVSLWNVSDQGTAHLMELFYKGLLHRHLRPAAALRAAQIEMLQSPDWQAPFYWAGFILEGEWK